MSISKDQTDMKEYSDLDQFTDNPLKRNDAFMPNNFFMNLIIFRYRLKPNNGKPRATKGLSHKISLSLTMPMVSGCLFIT